MKSTLFNMVAVLFTITLIASALVGVVYTVTEGPIAAAENKAKNEALKNVLPDFDKTSEQTVNLEGMQIKVYTATKSGKVVGYAVESMTKSGFSGEISLMVGLKPDGNVFNVNVLKHAETPGLGSKMCDAGNPLLASAKAVSPADATKFQVKKDGGELDALTAATISSRAYYDAILRAYRAYCKVTGKGDVAPETVQTEEAEQQSKLPEIDTQMVVETAKSMLPEYDELKESVIDIEGLPLNVYTAISQGQVVGYAVKTMSEAFEGYLVAVVAYDAQANVSDVAIILESESEPKAHAMQEKDNLLLSSVKRVSVADIDGYKLRSEGGELDALSGATVSTKAYYDAVARAYAALQIANEGFAAQKGGINE